jgi:hypothetical protein
MKAFSNEEVKVPRWKITFGMWATFLIGLITGILIQR